MTSKDLLIVGIAAFAAYYFLAGRARAQAAPVRVGTVDQWTTNSVFVSDYASNLIPNANNASVTNWDGGMSVDPNSIAGQVAQW